MSRPNRIVVYLKPPVASTPAVITLKRYGASDPATTEPDITTSAAGLRKLSPGQSIKFSLAALNNTRAVVYGPPVGWPGGCRAYLTCILGERGDNETPITGLEYGPVGPALACSELHYTFTADGILTCEDKMGVTITIDLNQPGKDALCLTLIPDGAGASAKVSFPNREFPDETCVK